VPVSGRPAWYKLCPFFFLPFWNTEVQPDIYVKVLERAADACGGASGVAVLLNASSAEVADWLAGRRAMPTEFFLKLVDVFYDDRGGTGSGALTGSVQMTSRPPILLPVVRAISERTLSEALALHDAGFGNIQLLNARGKLEIVAQRGFGRGFLDFFREVGVTDPSVCGRALEHAERVIVADVTKEPTLAGTDTQAVILAAGVRSVQSTPVISKHGLVFGMISTHFSRPGAAHAGLPSLEPIARRFADLLQALSLPAPG